MLSNNVPHVGHTTVTKLYDLFVAKFMVPVVGWKMFGQQRKKLFSNVYGNVFAKERVEPKNFSLSLFLVVIVVTVWVGLPGFVLNGVFEATSL